LPTRGERAFFAAGLELGRGQRHLGPGLGRFLGVEAGALEGVLVVVEDRGRAIERIRQHLPIGRGVIAGHRGHVDLRIELVAVLRHHLADRHDHAFGGHHGRGADLEHLQDVGGLTGAKSRDRRGHRHIVSPFVDRDDLEVFLAGIEAVGEVVDPIAEGARHRMPP